MNDTLRFVLTKTLGCNWKTTGCSLIAAVSGFVVFSPELFATHPALIALAKYTCTGGLLAFGIAAKDKHPDGKDTLN